ncbi:hypothetical protein C121_12 [Stenotrophomonas phage C121]|nr:hypothetical protein PP752_gp12 [Stenotrophomonas phage C121]UKL14745.1 hypothetical protein C121_12 [Stenotrophomonas phage C121]
MTFRTVFIMWLVWVAIILSVAGAGLYVAWHFISKFW